MSEYKSPKEVLLVEDDPGSAELTRIAIQRSKWEVNITVAPDCKVAFNILAKKGKYVNYARPNLILLDVSLPGMNGWEFLKEIRGNIELSGIPIYVLTVSQGQNDVQMCYELDADGFLNKPLSTEKFEKLVSSDEKFLLSIKPVPLSQLPPDIWY